MNPRIAVILAATVIVVSCIAAMTTAFLATMAAAVATGSVHP